MKAEQCSRTMRDERSEWMDVHRSLFPAHPRQPGVHRSESGQTALFIALFTPLLLVAVGALADAGRLLVEYRRAQVAIDAAAFAAAQRVDRNAFLSNQAIVLDPAEAVATGGLYGSLNSRGSVRLTAIEVSGGVVIARGYAEVDTIFLALFGAGRVHLDLTSRAVPLYGIWRETQ